MTLVTLWWQCCPGALIKVIIWYLFYSAPVLNMMTSSNGNIFRVTGPLCGEFTGPGEFPTQRSVTRSFGVFFDLRLNKRLSKQPWGWWFETPSWSLWRQCYEQSGLAQALAMTAIHHHIHHYMICAINSSYEIIYHRNFAVSRCKTSLVCSAPVART